MRGIRIHHFLAILWVCAGVSFAWASEAPPVVTKAYSLGEIVITDNMPGNKAITTLEITDIDIENRNAKTLDKALELLPGIDVSNGAQGTPRINIRGFRSRHTVLLLNGIPINSTYDGQFDPHLIPTENISKIKVSYGNNSVLYGQGGLAGVINIITKQGTRGFHGEASGEMDERGNASSRANVSGGNERADFFVSMSNKDSDGFLLSDDFNETPFENGGIRKNSDDERTSLFGNIGFHMNDDVNLGLTLERSFGELGTPPTTIDGKMDPLFAKNLKYDRTEDFDTLSAQLAIEYHPEGILGVRAWGFTNKHEEDLARYDDDTYSTQNSKGSYSSTDETTITGGTVQASLDFKSSGTAVVSFSGQNEKYTSDGQEVLKKNTPAETFSLDNEVDVYSAGLEYKVQLFSALDMVMGYSHHWQSREVGSDDDKGSYMIGASTEVTDTTTLRASYARQIRFPSLKQLYEPGGAGNSELSPEQSSNYEAGVTQQLPWQMEMDLAVFQNNVEDYIEKDVTDQNQNNEEYEFKGVEARLTKAILDRGTIGVAYSYLHTEDKSTGTEKDELQYRPTHKFTVDMTYKWDFGLTAHADFMRVAKQYYYSTDEDLPLEKRRLEDYSIINLKLEQKLYKENLFVYLGVDNLLDEAYEESYGYPQSGRTSYAGLRIKF